MRVLRLVGNVLLTALAVLGVLCGATWLAATAGWIQPLVVVSGSMEPEIRTGDLLVARPVAAAEVTPGQVVSLPSTLTGKLVTHRVIDVERRGDRFAIRMRGDANEAADGETYAVEADGTVWRPALRVPWAGYGVVRLTAPGVAPPLLVAVAALVALAMLPPMPRRDEVREPSEEQESEEQTA